MLRTSPCLLSKKKPSSPFALHVFTNVKMKYQQTIRSTNTIYTSRISSESVNQGIIIVYFIFCFILVRQF